LSRLSNIPDFDSVIAVLAQRDIVKSYRVRWGLGGCHFVGPPRPLQLSVKMAVKLGAIA